MCKWKILAFFRARTDAPVGFYGDENESVVVERVSQLSLSLSFSLPAAHQAFILTWLSSSSRLSSFRAPAFAIFQSRRRGDRAQTLQSATGRRLCGLCVLSRKRHERFASAASRREMLSRRTRKRSNDSHCSHSREPRHFLAAVMRMSFSRIRAESLTPFSPLNLASGLSSRSRPRQCAPRQCRHSLIYRT